MVFCARLHAGAEECIRQTYTYYVAERCIMQVAASHCMLTKLLAAGNDQLAKYMCQLQQCIKLLPTLLCAGGDQCFDQYSGLFAAIPTGR